MKLSSLLLLSVGANASSSDRPDVRSKQLRGWDQGQPEQRDVEYWEEYWPNEPFDLSMCIENLWYNEDVCSRECEAQSLGRKAIRGTLLEGQCMVKISGCFKSGEPKNFLKQKQKHHIEMLSKSMNKIVKITIYNRSFGHYTMGLVTASKQRSVFKINF